jgi:3-dehydroquinate synthase
MNTQQILVDLGDRSYPILIGNVLGQPDEGIDAIIRGRQVVIVCTEALPEAYADALASMLIAGRSVDRIVLPDGEQHKNIATLEYLLTRMLEIGLDRKAVLAVIGGGVVGDMAGFASAVYQRGISFIQVPTTLLAQVDSSVGGKTGVNHPMGKNMIGAFHQPRAVLADTGVLDTLPDRELSAGLAEVIKYGLIRKPDFFDWLEASLDLLLARDRIAMQKAIRISCETKAEVVTEDERESGVRAILNLGHTFGHAIEASLGYGQWLHGEAVAAGMLMAVDLSVRIGWVESGLRTRLAKMLVAAGLPVRAPEGMSPDDFMHYMRLDKKVEDHKIRLVLLRKLGDAVIVEDYAPSLLDQTLQAFTGEAPQNFSLE